MERHVFLHEAVSVSYSIINIKQNVLVKYKTAIITMTLSCRQKVACSPRDITDILT